MDISIELQCPICFERFTDPRSLNNCLHTFCEECLYQTFLTYQDRHPWKHDFPCPVCRVTVEGPRAGRNVDIKWIRTFPVNHVVNSLLHCSLQDENVEPSCEPCLNTNRTTPATAFCIQCQEFMCQSCKQIHQTFKSTKSHSLISVSELKTDKRRCIDFSKCLQCEYHKDKNVELFCVDEKMPVCVICVSTTHRDCRNIIELSTEAKSQQRMKETKTKQESLKEFQESLKSLILRMEQNVVDIEEQESEIKTVVETKIAEAVSILNRYESDIMDKFKQLKESKVQSMNEELEKCKRLYSGIKSSTSAFDTVMKYGSKVHAFTTMFKMESQFNEYKAFMETAERDIQNEKVVVIDRPPLWHFLNAYSIGYARMQSYMPEITASTKAKFEDKKKQSVSADIDESNNKLEPESTGAVGGIELGETEIVENAENVAAPTQEVGQRKVKRVKVRRGCTQPAAPVSSVRDKIGRISLTSLTSFPATYGMTTFTSSYNSSSASDINTLSNSITNPFQIPTHTMGINNWSSQSADTINEGGGKKLKSLMPFPAPVTTPICFSNVPTFNFGRATLSASSFVYYFASTSTRESLTTLPGVPLGQPSLASLGHPSLASSGQPSLASLGQLSGISMGQTLGATVGHPFATSVSHPFATSVSQPFATSVSRPFATSVSQPFATSVSQPFATSVSQSFATSMSQPYGTSVGQPFGASVSQLFGTSVGQSFVASVGQPFVASVGQPFVASVGQPFRGSLRQPFGTSVSQPFGASVSQPFGTSVSQPFGISVSQPFGTSVCQPIGTSVGQPLGISVFQPFGTSTGQPLGPSVRQQFGTSVGQPFGTSASQPFGTSVFQPFGTSTGQPLGTSVGKQFGTSVGQPFGTSVSQPFGTSVSQPFGTSVFQPFRTSTGQPLGTSVSQPLGTSVSQPLGTSMGQPLGTSVGQPLGTSVGQPLGSAVGQPFETLGQSLGTLVGQSLETSVGQQFGTSVSQPLGISGGKPLGISACKTSRTSVGMLLGTSAGQPSRTSVSQPLQTSAVMQSGLFTFQAVPSNSLISQETSSSDKIKSSINLPGTTTNTSCSFSVSAVSSHNSMSFANVTCTSFSFLPQSNTVSHAPLLSTYSTTRASEILETVLVTNSVPNPSAASVSTFASFVLNSTSKLASTVSNRVTGSSPNKLVKTSSKSQSGLRNTNLTAHTTSQILLPNSSTAGSTVSSVQIISSTVGSTVSSVPITSSTAGSTFSSVPITSSTAGSTVSSVPITSSTAGSTFCSVPITSSTVGSTFCSLLKTSSTVGSTVSSVPITFSTVGSTFSSVPITSSTIGSKFSSVPIMSSTVVSTVSSVPITSSTVGSTLSSIPITSSTVGSTFSSVPTTSSTAGSTFCSVPITSSTVGSTFFSVLITSSTVGCTVSSVPITSSTVGSTFSSVPITSSTVGSTFSSEPITSSYVGLTVSSVPITSSTVGSTLSSVPITSSYVGSTVSSVPITSSIVGSTLSSVPITSFTVGSTLSNVPITSSTVVSTVSSVPITSSTVVSTVSSVPITSSTVGSTFSSVPITSSTVGSTFSSVPITSSTVGSTLSNVPITSSTVVSTFSSVPTTSSTVGSTVSSVPITSSTQVYQSALSTAEQKMTFGGPPTFVQPLVPVPQATSIRSAFGSITKSDQSTLPFFASLSAEQARRDQLSSTNSTHPHVSQPATVNASQCQVASVPTSEPLFTLRSSGSNLSSVQLPSATSVDSCASLSTLNSVTALKPGNCIVPPLKHGSPVSLATSFTHLSLTQQQSSTDKSATLVNNTDPNMEIKTAAKKLIKSALAQIEQGIPIEQINSSITDSINQKILSENEQGPTRNSIPVTGSDCIQFVTSPSACLGMSPSHASPKSNTRRHIKSPRYKLGKKDCQSGPPFKVVLPENWKCGFKSVSTKTVSVSNKNCVESKVGGDISKDETKDQSTEVAGAKIEQDNGTYSLHLELHLDALAKKETEKIKNNENPSLNYGPQDITVKSFHDDIVSSKGKENNNEANKPTLDQTSSILNDKPDLSRNGSKENLGAVGNKNGENAGAPEAANSKKGLLNNDIEKYKSAENNIKQKSPALDLNETKNEKGHAGVENQVIGSVESEHELNLNSGIKSAREETNDQIVLRESMDKTKLQGSIESGGLSGESQHGVKPITHDQSGVSHEHDLYKNMSESSESDSSSEYESTDENEACGQK